MNYHGIQKGTLVNGEGVRVVLWVAGCNHQCKGCQNPDTWNPKGGIRFDEHAKEALIKAVGRKWCDGVTFSGGDPLFPDNRAEITEIAKEIKELYPEKNIWLYTGYTYEEICELEVMEYIDVLVDGEFVAELKDENCMWRGSNNQKVIDVKERRKNG